MALLTLDRPAASFVRRTAHAERRRTMTRAMVLTIVLAAGGAAAWSVSAECSTQASKPKWTPAPGGPVKVGPQAGKMSVGDINGDGNLDIAVACGACCGDKHCADGGHIAVLLGDGKGGLALAGK